MGQMSIIVDVMIYIFRDFDHSQLLSMNRICNLYDLS